MNSCVFCDLSDRAILGEEEGCLAIRDAFPVSPGHTLLIPRRHTASFSDLTPNEWQALFRLARALKERMIREDPGIEGFNLGLNDGAAAGQTIFHVHLHLIPRRRGDVNNPRGGIRAIIPGRADYPGT
jgi:ATP adenylyltransferase